MEQRSLRLGDIVDDYCPRERRVTNHAIVALVGNSIRQTRCSTCDAEHEYKEAKVPKKRGKGDSSEVADLSGGVLVTSKPSANRAAADEVDNGTNEVAAAPAADAPAPAAETTVPVQQVEDQNGNHGASDNAQNDSWFSHRPLIRASLPRTEGEPPARAIPEFTMHQRHGRGFGGRGGFRHSHQAGGNGSYRGGNGHHHNQHTQSNGNGNEPDGNRAPQPGRPGGPGGGGGRRRRRRRPR